MRNWLVVIFIGALIVISFLIWGDWFTSLFMDGKAIDFLEKFGNYGWLIGIILLIGDLFLPLPATLIMSAMGYLYGPLVGGLLASLGNFLSGMLAFGICRSIGRKGALRILGQSDLDRGESLFENRGGWIVSISRWLPIIPEIISCMAGLNQMRVNKFTLALACGCLPLGFVFAWIGSTGRDEPVFALVISAVLPLILWLIAQKLLRKSMA